tara:strand:+ start:10519 stop:11841 length:1323 start_codon:yes stop_codon:yes gene_type:complete
MSEGVNQGGVDEVTARRMWWASLEIIQQDFLLKSDINNGLWITAPLPSLYETKLLDKMKGWVWTPESLNTMKDNFGLLPETLSNNINNDHRKYESLPLRKEDGLDPFLILITSEIQVALALHGPTDNRKLLMRSDRNSLKELITMLEARLNLEDTEYSNEIKKVMEEIGILNIDDQLANRFWPLLSSKLAGMAPSVNIQTFIENDSKQKINPNQINDITILEAISHEVRTPLSTIRTLIRSLLRRDDLLEPFKERLIQIDNECTEQINRFGLIFKAVELERNNEPKLDLTLIDLGVILHDLAPEWKTQLKRRGIFFRLEISRDLPRIFSNSEKLEVMLKGIIDKNSRGLQSGKTLVLELSPAGQRLKLQLFVDDDGSSYGSDFIAELGADLGTVLNWNSETGSLQLSKGATKRMLASLGGHVRQRKGTGLTVFFPIAEVD